MLFRIRKNILPRNRYFSIFLLRFYSIDRLPLTRKSLFLLVYFCLYLSSYIPFYIPSIKAETPKVQIPLVGRPAESFYNSAGKNIQVSFEISPSKGDSQQWFQLRLLVNNIDNPEEMQIPDLNKIAEFHQHFTFQDYKNSKPLIHGKQWSFVYKIRPRFEGVIAIPSLPFRYYRVGAVGDNPNLLFPLTRTAPLSIEVNSPANDTTSSPETESVVKMPIWYENTSRERYRSSSSWDRFISKIHPSWLLIIPILIGIYHIYRYYRFPDARRKLQILRQHGIREFLAGCAQLSKEYQLSNKMDNSIYFDRLMALVLTYLERRWKLKSGGMLPNEIARWISSQESFPPYYLHRLIELFQLIHEQRFAQNQSVPLVPLIDELTVLVQEIESRVVAEQKRSSTASDRSFVPFLESENSVQNWGVIHKNNRFEWIYPDPLDTKNDHPILSP